MTCVDLLYCTTGLHPLPNRELRRAELAVGELRLLGAVLGLGLGKG